MLEEKDFTIAEIMAELGISPESQNPKQCIDRKLDRLKVVYGSDGRGTNRIYHITEIPENDEFKFYCMYKFGVSPQKDFRKLREVLYLALNDDSFMAKPDTEKQDFMRASGMTITRQTIRNNLNLLVNANFLGGGNVVYMVVSKDAKKNHISRVISKELYCKGWKIYWTTRAETDGDYMYAYEMMHSFLEGHPLKQVIPEKNAFMLTEIDRLQEIICHSYLKDLK